MATKTKVVIEVEGGVVQAVYSNWNDAYIDVILVDHDDLKEEGKTNEERDAILEKETKDLVEVGYARPEGTGNW